MALQGAQPPAKRKNYPTHRLEFRVYAVGSRENITSTLQVNLLFIKGKPPLPGKHPVLINLDEFSVRACLKIVSDAAAGDVGFGRGEVPTRRDDARANEAQSQKPRRPKGFALPNHLAIAFFQQKIKCQAIGISFMIIRFAEKQRRSEFSDRLLTGTMPLKSNRIYGITLAFGIKAEFSAIF